MKKHVLLLLCTFYSLNSLGEDNACYIQDCHGNKYRIVTIGNQIWMAENLRSFSYDTFSECYGKDLEFVDATNRHNWELKISAPTWIKSQVSHYGFFYNWHSAVGLLCGEDKNECDYERVMKNIKIQGICPNGWHIPSRAEWLELIQYADSVNHGESAAKMLKASEGWKVTENASVGVDQYGFRALPTGEVYEKIKDGHAERCIYHIGEVSCFWTSTVDKYGDPYEFMFGDNRDYVEDDVSFPDEGGCSVRCVKD